MIKIDREKSIAIIEIHGTPKLSDLQQAIEALIENPDHIDCMDEIWDFREASMTSFSAQDLQKLASFVKKHLHQLAKRSAFIVGRDFEYGLGRMWEVYAGEMVPKERKIFRDMDEAFKWLAK